MSTDTPTRFTVEDFDAPPDPLALAGVLFADDFDLDPAPATAPPAPPPLTAADLHAARAVGFAEGEAAAIAETKLRAAGAAAAAQQALERALASAGAACGVAAEAASRALAHTMLQALATVLPELCAQHGAGEAAALAQALLPLLVQQPRIVIRANPHTLPALRPIAEAQTSAERISLIATDALAEADVSIAWQDGVATRDSAAMLRELGGLLSPLGVTLPAPPVRSSASSLLPAGARPPHPHHRELADA